MSTNQKIKYVLTIMCVLLAVIGVTVYFNIPKENELQDNVTLKINEETTKTLKAKITNIYPGSSHSYTIQLEAKNIKNLNVYLTFRDNSDKENQLKNYIDVKIESNQKVIERTLKDLLENKETYSLGMNTNQIVITYSMSEDVGNEAKGTEAIFYIDLKAKALETR